MHLVSFTNTVYTLLDENLHCLIELYFDRYLAKMVEVSKTTMIQGLIQDFVMGEAKVKMEGTFAARTMTLGAKWFRGEGVSPCHWWGLEATPRKFFKLTLQMVHSGAIPSMTFKTIKSEKKIAHYQRCLWGYLHVNVASCKECGGLHFLFLSIILSAHIP